jgi:hypothetical protein
MIDLLPAVLAVRVETTPAAAADPSSVPGTPPSEAAPAAASPSATGSAAESDHATLADLPDKTEPDAAIS